MSQQTTPQRIDPQVRAVFERHNYDVLGELGRGGMGVVYLAQHRKLGRRVAVKTLSPERMAKENSMARFEREAKVFASIRHPHIANLYEFEDEGPLAFLALEYVEGTDLEKERKKGRRWTSEETARILLAMAEALAHTHEKGILHRDIKPGNILIEKGTNRSVLTDFGLAKGQTDDTLTAAGFAVGTPAYMAPEQITDQFGGKPDGRADLFSLGVVAYEMLTQVHPFLTADDLNTMRNIVNGKHKTLAEYPALAIPEELCDAIEELLAKDPKDRTPDAHTLAERMRVFLGYSGSGGVPIPIPAKVPQTPQDEDSESPPHPRAPQPPATTPTSTGLSKGQMGFILAIALIALIVGVAVGIYLAR